MIAFAYYGAKNGLLKDLLPLLPECSHYCEPFSGSATVLLNRKPSPIETLNDLNGEIVNFFEVLRDNAGNLVDKLLLTPYSRKEFESAWEIHPDIVERARRFFIRTQMDISKGGIKYNKSWSSAATASHSNPAKRFFNKLPGLLEVAERLRLVQVENKPAIDVIMKYDKYDTLFYLDPPYLKQTRNAKNEYAFEMSMVEHVQLAKALNAARGMVALSGYDSPEMGILYNGWNKILFKPKIVPMSRGNGLVRQECLWLNYDPQVKADLYKKQYRIL